MTVDRKRIVSLDASVFVDEDGSVAFLDMPDGVVCPPHVQHLRYLSDIPSVFSLAMRALVHQTRDGRNPQQALADHIGVRQQSISKWENALFAPRLTSSQWSKLVKLAIAAPERESCQGTINGNPNRGSL